MNGMKHNPCGIFDNGGLPKMDYPGGLFTG
jgi:hypothetical protein